MASNTCAICWEEVAEEEKFVTTCKPVGHTYHIGCIKFSYQKFKIKECPMCRNPLNININNLYPMCKHILTKGKNKGKNCSRKGKMEGFCEMHKKMNDLKISEPESEDKTPVEPKNKTVHICEAICNNGKKCTNKAKLLLVHKDNNTTGHFCGIHKNYSLYQPIVSELIST